MYRCLNCNREFDEPKNLKVFPLNDSYFEVEEVCPYCNNYFEEVEGEEE